MLNADQPECWPALPLDSWQDTYATLHMWSQMVGKVRLALTPVVNHWWNVPLYVTARGLTTSRIPYGKRAFLIKMDKKRIRIKAGKKFVYVKRITRKKLCAEINELRKLCKIR